MVGPQNNDLKNIVEVLKTYDGEGAAESDLKSGELSRRNATFNTLVAALVETDLLDVVINNELTVFAPTDAAFAELGLNPGNIGAVPGLADILLYHVVGGRVYSYNLTPGFVPTLNSAAVEVKLNGRTATINNANLPARNIEALNGVVHIVDKVLLPPTMDIVDLAISFAPEFSTLVNAVVQAELVDVLKGDGPFTVFAPTNEAFEKLGIDLSTLSKEDLTAILLYHVVPGRVYSSDLSTGSVATLNGDIYIDLSDLTIKDNGSIDKANLIAALLNVQATNGVIHVIDKVLLP
ncbi:MAG: fasciclin domain-containing protein [Chloroflexia bacterium]|nr:fasciclin domain-containing protein [Chloroflexia bacterium]